MEGRKKIIVYTIAIAFIILIISSLVVFATSNNKEVSLEEKVTTEIEYLSSKLIGILNQFNGFSFIGYDVSSRAEDPQTETGQEENQNEDTDEGNLTVNSNSDSNKNQILNFNGKYKTNWETIAYQVEEIYQTWNTVVIDLHTLNVNSDSIFKFSNMLNQATKQIKDKNRKEAMLRISELYELLPEYAKSYKSDSNWNNLLEIKSNVVKSYSYVSNEQWNEAKTEINNATRLFTERLNSVNSKSENQTDSNKVYILIHELSNAIDLKDKEIFFINYSNAIEKLDII